MTDDQITRRLLNCFKVSHIMSKEEEERIEAFIAGEHFWDALENSEEYWQRDHLRRKLTEYFFEVDSKSPTELEARCGIYKIQQEIIKCAEHFCASPDKPARTRCVRDGKYNHGHGR